MKTYKPYHISRSSNMMKPRIHFTDHLFGVKFYRISACANGRALVSLAARGRLYYGQHVRNAIFDDSSAVVMTRVSRTEQNGNWLLSLLRQGNLYYVSER